MIRENLSRDLLVGLQKCRIMGPSYPSFMKALEVALPSDSEVTPESVPQVTAVQQWLQILRALIPEMLLEQSMGRMHWRDMMEELGDELRPERGWKRAVRVTADPVVLRHGQADVLEQKVLSFPGQELSARLLVQRLSDEYGLYEAIPGGSRRAGGRDLFNAEVVEDHRLMEQNGEWYYHLYLALGE